MHEKDDCNTKFDGKRWCPLGPENSLDKQTIDHSHLLGITTSQ